MVILCNHKHLTHESGWCMVCCAACRGGDSPLMGLRVGQGF